MALSKIAPIATAGAGLLGSVYGAVQQRKAATRAHERSKELQERSHEMNLDMWKKTNYGAQRTELENAGLNAGLMYGTAGQGGQAVGGAATAGAQEQVGDYGAQAQAAAMTAAQLKLTEAQTAKTTAETEKIAGADTAESESRINLNTIEAEFKRIATDVSGATQESQINIINDTSDKLLAEAVQQQHQQIISEQTYKDTIKRIKEEAVGALLENTVKRTNAEVNEARIKEISANILQRWESIAVDKRGQEIQVENMERMVEGMLWGAGINAAGNLAGDIVRIVTRQKQEQSRHK